jgi:PTH2 family peptidyl-tRNA hydrolase
MEKVKQIIVWRGDLKCRKGKMMAQAAHSSLAVFLNSCKKIVATEEIPNTSMLESIKNIFKRNKTRNVHVYAFECIEGSAWEQWLNGKFTKIAVSCKDEEELLSLYKQAKESNIPCSLITDAGLTEFKGVPTNTCIAIGPYWSEDIDKITKHLPLL